MTADKLIEQIRIWLSWVPPGHAKAAKDDLDALASLVRDTQAENERKVEAYDAARATVKREGRTRAEYALRAESAERRLAVAVEALEEAEAVAENFLPMAQQRDDLLAKLSEVGDCLPVIRDALWGGSPGAALRYCQTRIHKALAAVGSPDADNPTAPETQT